MLIDQLVAAVGDARGVAALDTISRAVWRGLAEGILGDGDAQMLAELIHAKRAVGSAGKGAGGHERPAAQYPARRPQRPPVRSAAIERRRRLAMSGPLPPGLACRFTVGELAVLRIVGDECRDRGACMLPLGAIAARAGVCRKLAQNAIRLAKRLGLLDVDERRRPGRPSLTNVIKVASTEWRAWLARGPRPKRGGGKKSAPTDTKISLQKKERAKKPLRNLPGRRRWLGKGRGQAMR